MGLVSKVHLCWGNPVVGLCPTDGRVLCGISILLLQLCLWAFCAFWGTVSQVSSERSCHCLLSALSPSPQASQKLMLRPTWTKWHTAHQGAAWRRGNQGKLPHLALGPRGARRCGKHSPSSLQPPGGQRGLYVQRVLLMPRVSQLSGRGWKDLQVLLPSGFSASNTVSVGVILCLGSHDFIIMFLKSNPWTSCCAQPVGTQSTVTAKALCSRSSCAHSCQKTASCWQLDFYLYSKEPCNPKLLVSRVNQQIHCYYFQYV